MISKEMSNIIAGNKTVEQAAADAEKELIGMGYKAGESGAW